MPRAVIALVWVGTGLLTLALAAFVSELTSAPPKAVPMEEGSRPRREANAWARWTVTEQLSAHHVLIVHVETQYLHEAKAIAQQVAGQLSEKYAEILVYVHRPGRPDAVAPRRVQWTREKGYVETIYAK